MKVSRRQFIINSAKSITGIAIAIKTIPFDALISSSSAETLSNDLPDAVCRQGLTGLSPPCVQVSMTKKIMRLKSGKSRYFPSKEHVHFFDIPLEIFMNPPEEGVSFLTTESHRPFKHRHKVSLTQVEIMSIALGDIVEFWDGKFDHKWIFQIEPGNPSSNVWK